MRNIIRLAAALLTTATTAAPLPAHAQLVLQWQTANLVEKQFEPVWKQMVAEFEAANPGIRIEPLLVARRDHWTRFVTAAQARRAPCIISVDVATAAYNGYLLPLDRFWAAEPASFRAAWSDDTLAGSRWENKLFGLPVWGGVYADLYNRQMVVDAGLDPARPPRSFPEYLAWMRALTRPGARWGTALTAGPTDTTTRSLLTWIWANGGEAFDPAMTRATFAANPRSLEAIRFYVDLVRQGVAAPGATTTNYLEQTNLFAQGRIASMRTAYWAIAKVEGDAPALKGGILVAPPPGEGTPPVLATQTASSISSACPHPDEAWKFIVFEAQPKWAVLRAKVANWLPLRRDLAALPEIAGDPDMTAFLRMAANARAYPLPSPIWADIAASDIVAAIQRAILDPDQVDRIFRDLDTLLTRKLKEG